MFIRTCHGEHVAFGRYRQRSMVCKAVNCLSSTWSYNYDCTTSDIMYILLLSINSYLEGLYWYTVYTGTCCTHASVIFYSYKVYIESCYILNVDTDFIYGWYRCTGERTWLSLTPWSNVPALEWVPFLGGAELNSSRSALNGDTTIDEVGSTWIIFFRHVYSKDASIGKLSACPGNTSHSMPAWVNWAESDEFTGRTWR